MIAWVHLIESSLMKSRPKTLLYLLKKKETINHKFTKQKAGKLKKAQLPCAPAWLFGI